MLLHNACSFLLINSWAPWLMMTKQAVNSPVLVRRRISQTENTGQVLKSKHVHVSKNWFQCGFNRPQVKHTSLLLWLKREKNKRSDTAYMKVVITWGQMSQWGVAETRKQVQTTCYCKVWRGCCLAGYTCCNVFGFLSSRLHCHNISLRHSANMRLNKDYWQFRTRVKVK